MRKQIIAIVMALGMIFAASSVMAATNVAVVDAGKIFVESTPGKAGEAHLVQVQEILQKGMDDLQTIYTGKEDTPEAIQDIAQAFNALNQQLNIERQAVQNVLNELLIESVKEWRVKNKKYDMVLNSQLILDYTKNMDVTPAILKIYNTKTPQFAELPQVTVTPPNATAPRAN